MPEMKGLLWSVGTGVIAVIGTLIVTSMFTTVEEGAEALETQRITGIVEAAMEAKMVTIIDGETFTYGEALSKIYTEQVALSAAVGVLMGDQ